MRVVSVASWRPGRSRVTSVVAVATLPVLVATLAFVERGFPLARLDLDDGAVWLTSSASLMLGRYNVPVEELNAGLVADDADLDVLQDGSDVLLVQPTSVSVVDPATVTASTEIATAGVTTSMAGGTVAFVDGDGSVWVRDLHTLTALAFTQEDPEVELGEGGALVVSRTGVALAVSAQDGAVTRIDPGTDGPGSTGSAGSVGAGDIEQLTAVGEEPVVLAGSTLRTTHGTVQLDGDDLMLQQPGPASTRVLVASRTALLEVPLDGGDVVVHETGGTGLPAAPVQVGGCALGAWASSSDNALTLCAGGSASVQTLQDLRATDTVVFRVNRSMVVLNDTVSGRLWLPLQDTEVRQPDWQQVAPQSDPDPAPDPDPGTTTQDLSAECGTDSHAPTAVDDELGVRAGRTSVLAVLDNDSSSDCGVLVITEFEPLRADFGTLVAVYGGRALQIDVLPDAQGSATFAYTISDGRGTTPPSTAQVTVHVGGADDNAAPVQVRVPRVTVDAGGQATQDVLAGFVDPDGDDLRLVGASVDPTYGTVLFRQDGTATFRADGGTLGQVAVAVQVSDGTATTAGEMLVDVRAAGSVPPHVDPVFAVTYANQPVTLHPLDFVRTSTSEPARLASVEDVVGATVAPDLVAGTFTFTAAQPGTYYVPFLVTAAPQQATGLARIDVRAWPEQVQPPVAVRDRAFLPSGGQVTVDPLANDEDPAGNVLVLQDVTVPDGYGLKVAVLDHHLVQIWAERTLAGPVEVAYTVSNGAASAQGRIVVTPVEAGGPSQPPVVDNVEVSVRAGGVVTIPVLDGAYDPDGDELSLVGELAEPLADGDGLLFVSGDVLRYQAPSRALTARATFVVADSSGRTTAATVTVRVHESDAEGKKPPQPRDLVARVYSGDSVRIAVPLVGIDGDGDGVTLLGLASAPVKGVVSVGADYLEYEALPGESGTDSFTYAVEDWTGQRAVATVRVGIADRPTSAASVVARDDAVTLRPGQSAEVRVLANDVDSSGGALALDPTLEVPDGVEARADVTSGRVVVTAPADDGTVQILYAATNQRGGRDTAVLTVTVAADAPVLPPIARDVIVPASDTFGLTSVAVDVLAVAQNPSGPLSDLELSVPTTAASVAVVVGRTVVVALAGTAQTIPYLLTNATDPSAWTYAFITVPALGNFPPTLRPGLDELTIASGVPLVIPLDERIKVAPGRSPSVADEAQVTATRSDGSALVVDSRTVQFTSAPDYAGPASVTVLVTDATGAGDLLARTALITLPITVVAADDHPPTFAPSQIRVGPGDAPLSVDLLAFLTGADGRPGVADDYEFDIASAVPAGFTVALSGSTLAVSAGAQVAKGTTGALDLTIGYGKSGSMTVTLDLAVTASTRQRARVLDWRVDDGVQGRATTVGVLSGAFNPYPDDGPLTVVGATVETAGAGIASATSSQVVVTPAADFVGELTVRYRVRDVTDDPDREVEGRVVLVVSGPPLQPAPPRVVEVRDRTVVLSWTAPDSRGRPITEYRVTAQPGNIVRSCVSTTCTIDALTNDVEYTFTVAARNAVDFSPPSDASAPARPDAVPDAPTSVSLAFADGALTAGWLAPPLTGSPVTSYTVQITPRTTTGQSTFTATSTTLRIGGLENGTSYTVQVQAHNRAPEPSAWSEAVTETPARAPDAPAPSASRRSTGVSGNVIDVTWAALAGGATGGDPVQRYEVSVDGGGWTDVGLATSYQIRDAERRQYQVRVVAVNKAGRSAQGLTTGEVWSAPGTPLNVTAESSSAGENRPWGDGRVVLRWDPPADSGGSGVTIASYLITGPTGAVTTVPGRQTSTEVTGLAGGSTPTFTVAALNTAGETGSPAGVTATTVVTAPQAPTVTVGPGDVDEVVIAVVFGDAGGAPILATEYRIDHGPWVAVTATAPLPTTYRSSRGAVLVEVRQHNGGAWVQGSGSGQPGQPGPPGAPTGLTAQVTPEGTALTLGWVAPASTGGRDLTTYEWRVRTEDGQSVLESAQTDAATLAATTTGSYPPGSTVSVDVRARNDSGAWGPWSTPVPVTFPSG